MADHSIYLKIGSAFNAQGFQKAQSAIASLNQSVRKGIGIASQISGMFGGLDEGCAKASKAVNGLLAALSSGHPALILIGLGITAINAAVDKLKGKADEAKERMAKLKAEVDKAFASALAERMHAITSEVQTIASEFETVTKQANAFAAAIEGVRSASSQGGILKLETERLQAMLDAHSEAERENIDAAYNLKIAQAKLIAAEEAGGEKVNAASEAVAQNKARIATIDKQLAALAEERARFEDSYLAERAVDAKKAEELEKNIGVLKSKEAELESQRLAALANGDVLEEKLQAAKLEAANATEEAKQGLLAVQLADNRLAEANHARAVAEEQARYEAELDAAAKEADRKALEEATSVQTDVNAAARELASAQAAYAAILRNAPQIAADWAANIAGGNAGGAANLTAEQMGKITGTVAGEALKQAIKDGRVQNMKDARDFERQAARDARDAANKAAFEARRDEQRYNQLKNKNDKLLSDKDKKWLEDFEAMKKAREDRLKDANDARKRVQDAEKMQQQAFDDIKRIRERLCGPGGGNK